MLAIDRALIAWLHRRHVPADIAYLLVVAAVAGALANLLPHVHRFWSAPSGVWLAGAALALCAVSLSAGRAARREKDLLLAVIARGTAALTVTAGLLAPAVLV